MATLCHLAVVVSQTAPRATVGLKDALPSWSRTRRRVEKQSRRPPEGVASGVPNKLNRLESTTYGLEQKLHALSELGQIAQRGGANHSP